MPTLPYYNAKGERLPGVTWVIGQNLGWNKDPLMIWANREGLAGRNIRAEKTTASKAADIGTAVHTMVEARILGWDPVAAAGSQLTDLSEEDRDKAHTGFSTFERWFRQTKINVIATEAYLIDEDYQTGGCLDGIGLEEGEGGKLELTVLDWKTSRGTYADHVVQVAAYTVMAETAINGWLENGPLIRFAGAYILRVDKETGVFSHKFIPRARLEQAWIAFTYLRALHQFKREIEALVR